MSQKADLADVVSQNIRSNRYETPFPQLMVSRRMSL
jgi:hypothetical protein